MCGASRLNTQKPSTKIATTIATGSRICTSEPSSAPALGVAWVMKAWAEQHDALGKIVMLADGSGLFSKALGIEVDLTKASMGMRCSRGVFIIEDGVVKSVDMEAAGKFEVSNVESCMLKLGA